MKAFARTVTNHTFSGVGTGAHLPDENGMLVRSWGDDEKEPKKNEAKSVKSTKVAPAASISVSPDESVVPPSSSLPVVKTSQDLQAIKEKLGGN